MRAADILAALPPDLPPDVINAIYDLDARAYLSNEPMRLTEAEAFIRLHKACKSAGSDAAFARKVGIKKQSLADIMNSKRPMSPAVLDAIGLRQVRLGRVYEPKEI